VDNLTSLKDHRNANRASVLTLELLILISEENWRKHWIYRLQGAIFQMCSLQIICNSFG